MKKSFVNLVSAALALALGQFCSGAAFAAPVVVTPGTNAGYIYFPPASVGSGGGTGGSLGSGGDANSTNCNASNVFATSVLQSTTGSVVIPKAVKCIYIEAGGGMGADGVQATFYTPNFPAPKGGMGSKVVQLVFNNTGVDLTLNWEVGVPAGSGSTGTSSNNYFGCGGMGGSNHLTAGGAGGTGARFFVNGTQLLAEACGGGGGAGGLLYKNNSANTCGMFGGSYGKGGLASAPAQGGENAAFDPTPLAPVAGTPPSGPTCTTFTKGGSMTTSGSASSYIRYSY